MPGPALAAEGAGWIAPDGCSEGAHRPQGAQMWAERSAEKSPGMPDENLDGIWWALEPLWQKGAFHLGGSENLLQQAILFV